ncbi:hypothetical protein ACSIGC_11260 [Tenacibaculum sp. ZS6-P6]|uniref:hypothetical protein n=1 Tax=Tenacibaculum sp. ZS6-P6 TaxID=3447503 RepID=UPI003F9E06CC
MLTNKEMEEVAERYIEKLGKESNIEMVLSDELSGKPYGNVYIFESKEFVLTGDQKKSLANNHPFMVEKEKGRVVTFGTMLSIENYLKAYENGTLLEVDDLYWYPDEDRYDSK